LSHQRLFPSLFLFLFALCCVLFPFFSPKFSLFASQFSSITTKSRVSISPFIPGKCYASSLLRFPPHLPIFGDPEFDLISIIWLDFGNFLFLFFCFYFSAPEFFVVVYVDFDSHRLSGGMFGGALNFSLIRETLFHFFPCFPCFPMAFTPRLGFPFFFFFFVFLFGFREIEMVVA